MYLFMVSSSQISHGTGRDLNLLEEGWSYTQGQGE